MCCLTLSRDVITLFVENVPRLRSIVSIAHRVSSSINYYVHSTLWVVDSGASSHFSVVREYFITLSLLDSGTLYGISVRVRGYGTCKPTLVDTLGRRCTVTLNGVFYVPDLALRANGNYLRLLSVTVATNRGCRFEFTLTCDILWTPREVYLRC
jgi:hypothetical protein